MSHHTKALRHPAFTLVELLVVIAIIGILAAIFIAIGPGVANAQRAARTKGEITTLNSALEDFKGVYYHYPMISGGASDSQGWQRALYNCMVGNQVLKVVNGEFQLVAYDRYLPQGKTTAAKRSFITDANIAKAKDSQTGQFYTEEMQYFTDAWENAYEYRYNIISSGKPGTTWERPGYLLISAGNKIQSTPPGSSDYFTGGMETTGQVPENYFDDEFRADNITNWRID